MPLRESPARTPALLAANRANAQKSAGARSPQGKARVALNALKHGRYVVRWQEKLVQAGDRGGDAQYRWFRSEIATAFGVSGPNEGRRAQRFAARAWCLGQKAACLGTKPECTLQSVGKAAQHDPLSRIWVDDRLRWIRPP